MVSRTQDDERWYAVESRDSRFDGDFVYAVATTGVYCRPSCPSRRPRRRNVHFYGSGYLAERGGFRACLRCRPDEKHGTRAEKAVEKAREILDCAAGNATLDQPTTLEYLARQTGVSPFHLQRHFKRIVGLSPKAYLTKQKSILLKKNLKKGGTVLHASYESGFGSPSSAYTAANRELGMSPSIYRRDGAGTDISYWLTATSMGRVIVAATQRGVCAVMIADSDTHLLEQLRAEFPKATLRKGATAQQKLVKSIVGIVEGQRSPNRIQLDVSGSPFQWRVWEALRNIPVGETRTYSEIAMAIGQPGAARAVGRACATNRAAVIIPCHRVIRRDGNSGDYRWGAERKQRLLSREAASDSKEMD